MDCHIDMQAHRVVGRQIDANRCKDTCRETYTRDTDKYIDSYEDR